MRKIFSTIAFLIATMATVPQPAFAVGGQDTPFPLDFPVAFPWGTIEGTWVVESDAIMTEFVFEIARNCDNTQILKVTQVNPVSGMIMAEGIGYRSDNSPTVYAAMKGRTGSYMVVVGAYKEKRVDMKRFYGLRVISFGNAAEIRYRINKKTDEVPFSRTPETTDCLTYP